MDRTPLVTALICNYNYGRYLREAIESALNQSYRPLEVIVVDDSSTDNSRQLLDGYKDRIRVILKENGGQASAFNVGIAAAKGEIICFLDSDDIWLPEKVATVVSKFQNSNWGLACHELTGIDSRGVALGQHSIDLVDPSRLREGNLLPLLVDSQFTWMFSPTSGMSIRAEVARNLFPFPEPQWRICADILIAYGASALAPVAAIRQPLAKYRFHATNGFATLRHDPHAHFANATVGRAKGYLYLRDLLTSRGMSLSCSPKDWYWEYRAYCLYARPQPWRGLSRLWKRNIAEAFSDDLPIWRSTLTACRRMVGDSLLSFLVPIGFGHVHQRRKRAFAKVLATLDASTLDFIQND